MCQRNISDRTLFRNHHNYQYKNYVLLIKNPTVRLDVSMLVFPSGAIAEVTETRG